MQGAVSMGLDWLQCARSQTLTARERKEGRDRPRKVGAVWVCLADPLAVPCSRVVVGHRADGLVHVENLPAATVLSVCSRATAAAIREVAPL